METLREAAGELLTIGFEGYQISPECQEMLTQVRPGGLIFFQRNIFDCDQFFQLVSQALDLLAARPSFLAIDMEGGTVDRLRHIVAPLPPVASVVAVGLARKLGSLAGRELAAFQLNVNFAPVLDLGFPASRDVLSSRTAGRTAADVVAFAREFLAGMAESGVIGCGKHFPGLGGGNLDSHVNMPEIARSFTEMWDQDLAPYRELAALLPMVMVAHAWYPALELELGYAGPPRPSSTAPTIVDDLLRRRIGYGGLVLCDDLEMGGVLQGRVIEQAAIAAVNAGCEVLLVCRHQSNVERVHRALIREAEQSSDFRRRLESAAAHILHSKRQLAVDRPIQSATTAADLAKLHEEIVRFADLVKAQQPLS